MKTTDFPHQGFYTRFNAAALASQFGEMVHLLQLLHSKLRQPRMPSLPRTVSVILLLILLYTACKEQKPRHIQRAVYYWKNNTYLGWEELKFLKENHIQKVYTKILDVDWDEVRGAIPLSINNIEYYRANIYPWDSVEVEFVPVIFITNKTFAQIDSSAIPQLALRIVRKCYTQFDSIDANAEKENVNNYSTVKVIPQEIQLDCDWTVSTARKYFYFLEEVKKVIGDRGAKLSATIRLHQYKYPKKTGVPPVDKGILMLYNMSDLTQYGKQNSIFEEKTAKEYIKAGSSYALPLDLALPAYGWGIVYRDKKFLKIESGMQAADLENKEYFQSNGNHFYAVIKDTVMNDVLLRPGDEIKIETIDEEKLLQAAKIARTAINSGSITISLFDLSASPLKKFSHETIDEVYNSFK
jgi:hypothetical protein